MTIDHYVENYATAFGAADASTLAGNRGQGVDEKFATGQQQQQLNYQKEKLVTPRNRMKIATWNVRTGYQVGNREIIARELIRYGISIAVLSELRLTGSGRVRVQVPNTDSFMLLYYSGGEKHIEGVGFAINQMVSKSVIAFQPISSRLAVLSLSGTVKTHIIAVYAPTEVSTDEAKDEFYSQFQEILDTLPRKDLILVAGDLNAHVGSNRQGWEDVLGKFGIGNMNDNGLRLLSFAAANELVVGNSLFRHPRKHQLTWQAPNGKDASVLDYILIRRRFRTSLTDVRTMRGADCGSDHHLVRGTLQIRFKQLCQASTSTKCRDWSKLANTTAEQCFRILLTNRFAALDRVDNVNEVAEQFAEVVNECAKEICPVVRRRTQPWISDESLELVNQRRQCKLTDATRYRQLNKEIRSRLKNERQAYWNNVAQELEDAAHRREYRYLYTTLRRLGGNIKRTSDNIRNIDGTFVRSDNERLNRWKEYFQNLYNHPTPEGNPADPPYLQGAAQSINDEEPSIAEIASAIKQLKSGKAAGPDEVVAEALKAGDKPLLNRLHSLLRMIWESDKIPNTWKKATIVPLLKKGDNQQCKNYRGISLLSIVGKVFMKVIQQRLQKRREQLAREEQAGFRPGRGCCDQIFALRQLLEERIRCGKRLIAVFIDFAAAFDSVTVQHYGNHWPPKVCLPRSYACYSRYTTARQAAFASTAKHLKTFQYTLAFDKVVLAHLCSSIWSLMQS